MTSALDFARARALGVACVLTLTQALRGETIAHWRFDEASGEPGNLILKDSGPRQRFSVATGPASLVAGKFGRALRPAAGLLPNRGSALRVTDSKLNLGEHDWTIECWLKLDRAAQAERVIFEIGSGPRGNEELVTRFSVLPRENAFLVSSLAPATGAAWEATARRIEFPNPEGPPGGEAIVQRVTLALEGASLRRETWSHVALVHRAGVGELRLFIDGRVRARATLRMMALPRDEGGYVSIGRDGAGTRVLAGELDELRISDAADYEVEFAVPRDGGGGR